MSDTPRTDEEESDGWSGDALCVSSSFARQLERELATEKEWSKDCSETIFRLTNELAAEKARADAWSEELGTANPQSGEPRGDLKESAKAWREIRRERNALAEQNAALRKIISDCAAAIGNWSACSPECSLEFMQFVPKEISGYAEKLRAILKLAINRADCGDAITEEDGDRVAMEIDWLRESKRVLANAQPENPPK